MTANEWNNLKVGDLVIYKGNTNGATNKRQTCKGLVVELIEHQIGDVWLCKQPYIESDFRFELHYLTVCDLYKKASD